MSNSTRTRKTQNTPVIMYPEGVIVGHVRSGKRADNGKVRHVATTEHGVRLGTFDMYREAADALLADARRRMRSALAQPAPAEHVVELVEAPASRAHYGIRYLSRYVFRTSRGSHPTRVVYWDNTGRENPRNGEPVRFGEYGPIDGGHGKYLDPHRRATDAAVSILLSPEASAITNNGTNTGTEASGQVYASAGAVIREGDHLHLVWPSGARVSFTAHFTNNGHGYLLPFDREPMLVGPESIATPKETPAARRERLAGELVTETMDATDDHRYARAYGILAGLVRGMTADAEGERAAALAREYVRQLDEALGK